MSLLGTRGTEGLRHRRKSGHREQQPKTCRWCCCPTAAPQKVPWCTVTQCTHKLYCRRPIPAPNHLIYSTGHLPRHCRLPGTRPASFSHKMHTMRPPFHLSERTWFIALAGQPLPKPIMAIVYPGIASPPQLGLLSPKVQCPLLSSVIQKRGK